MAKQKSSPIIPIAVALGALIFFGYLSRSPDPNPPADGAAAVKQNTAPAASQQQAAQQPGAIQKTSAMPQGNFNVQNGPIPEGLPEDLKRAITEPPAELPPDLKAQLNAPPPELPEDLKRQLAMPPQELPDDLKAQLNAPPPPLPDDIKKALETPPRVVTLDEVNTPLEDR